MSILDIDNILDEADEAIKNYKLQHDSIRDLATKMEYNYTHSHRKTMYKRMNFRVTFHSLTSGFDYDWSLMYPCGTLHTESESRQQDMIKHLEDLCHPGDVVYMKNEE